jgi:isoleucyl-tRNA synthetase
MYKLKYHPCLVTLNCRNYFLSRQLPILSSFHRFPVLSFAGQEQQQDPSVDSEDDVNKKYSKTLILPSTSFSMRSNALENEPKLQQICSRYVYQWQKENLNDEKKFVLHDGPPYANGSLHMGHALNKILKDFINRYKLLRGYKINFIPGWDCHGLPIEMKAINQSNNEQISPTIIRKLSREFAEKTIQKQKRDFERWGIMGDWDNYYTTMHPEFEARQLEVFLSMYLKGCIYRGVRPVYWSPSSRTALAEAELEYPEAHTSKSIYVLFPIDTSKATSNRLSHLTSLEGGLYVAVWTTTPWTLMANEAVCYSKNVQYSVMKAVNKKSGVVKHLLVADALLDAFLKKTESKYEYTKVSSIVGDELEGYYCEHPFVDSKLVPLLHGPHVTTDMGTGFVHTAPGHGMEDFLIGKQYNLPVTSPVDDSGCYTSDVIIKQLAGRNVFTDGNDGVIKLLQEHPDERLILLENYVHKYPYDWRTKKPVLIRTTKQWFADLTNLKDLAVKALDSVDMVPEVGRVRLTSFVKSRTEWCISRQRVWGVPIPVFYNKHNSDEYLATEESIRHVINLFKEHGSDCWWNFSTENLLAPKYRNSGVEYIRGTDTLDVWFDSGTTWYGVIERHKEKLPVDLYLEGSDQHRGWFQSSLLTSIAHNNQAPYKAVITHGFVLDEESRKMSKSLGNIVEPSLIVEGKKSSEEIQAEPKQQQKEDSIDINSVTDEKEKKKKLLKKLQKQKAAEKKSKDQVQSVAYGADVLRLWASMYDFTSDVSIGESVIGTVFETLKKIRNTERFLLGNLSDFTTDQRLEYNELQSVDKYMLLKLYEFLNHTEHEYERFAFHKVHQLIVSFAFSISAFYLDISKDRLYLEDRLSKARKSCQTVISYIFENYTKAIAPILCHTAEDAFQHSPFVSNDKKSIFTTGWFTMDEAWDNEQIRNDWELIIKLRQEIYKLTEQARSDKLFSTTLGSHIELHIECDAVKKALSSVSEEELEEAFIVSKIEYNDQLPKLLDENLSKYSATFSTPAGGKVYIQVSQAKKHKCPRCWRYVSASPLALCSRCASVLSTHSHQ